MTSLSRFRQRLSGEPQVKITANKSQSDLVEWVKLVTEIETQEQINSPQEIELDIADEEFALEVDLESMTKVELDNHALDNGIQLDRRQSKKNMINEFIQKLKEKN